MRKRSPKARRRSAARRAANAALKGAHPKFRKLINAREMDFFLSSESPNVVGLVEAISAELGLSLPAQRRKTRKRHLEALLLNLYAAYAVSPSRHVAIGFGRNEYSKRGRYWPAWASHDMTTKLVRALESANYLEREPGFYDREKSRGFKTRIRATPTLVERFEDAKLSPNILLRSKDFELIHLKDIEKTRIEYCDDQNTERMRDLLKSINCSISQAFIGLHVPDSVICEISGKYFDDGYEKFDDEEPTPVEFTHSRLYRVFNDGSFERGGDFTAAGGSRSPVIFASIFTLRISTAKYRSRLER